MICLLMQDELPWLVEVPVARIAGFLRVEV